MSEDMVSKMDGFMDQGESMHDRIEELEAEVERLRGDDLDDCDSIAMECCGALLNGSAGWTYNGESSDALRSIARWMEEHE